VVFALKPNGDVVYLCRQFDGGNDKQFVYNMYASIMQMEKIRMYSFISEMWFYKSKTASDVLPSEHPDKQSGAMIITKDKNKTLINMFPIIDEQLMDDDNDGFDDYTDYIDLFNRIPSLSKTDLNNLSKVKTPKWYTTLKHADFINVAVES
jgi:hypothetical protein